MRSRTVSIIALLAGTCLATQALAQVDNPEVEGNDSKATATIANSGGAGMAAGDTISGTSISASTTGLDYFRVRTALAAPGIYRHRLVITSAIAGHTGTIRGLNVVAAAADTLAGIPWNGVIGTTGVTDATLQTSSTATTPARFNQWYGFGKGEEIFYRVTGVAATTAPYLSTLETTPVMATDLGQFVDGVIRFNFTGQGHTTDTDMWVYDSMFNAIPGFGNDDASAALGGAPIATTSLQSFLARTFAPGVYYIAVTNFGVSTNQPAASDDNFRTASVLDFPDAALNTSTTINLNVAFTVSDVVGTMVPVASTKAGAFDVNWFRFEVIPNTNPTNPVGVGSATPTSAIIGQEVTFTVTVTPGINPPSSAITVVLDASQMDASSTVMLLDDGVFPDASAGDNVFTGAATVGAMATGGAKVLPFTVADGEMRSSMGNINLNVVAPPATDFDFGDMSTPNCQTQTFDLAAAQVRWFRFNLSTAADASLGTFLDIDTENTAGCVDTEIGVYRPDGTLVVSDDDDGSGLLSQISFGVGGRPAAPIGPGCAGAGALYNGRDGTLPAGTYFLCASRFSTTHGATNFAVTSTGAASTGIVLNICSVPPTTPPTGVGSVAPTQVNELTTATLRVTVNPGLSPPSTGIAVVADASSLGGSAALTLLDDGVAPDLVAGDNIFSANVATTVPAAIYPVPFTVSDAEMRSSNGSFNVTVVALNGACCGPEITCQLAGPFNCGAMGGTYLGAGTLCGGIATYDFFPNAGGAFEDISGTGTVISAAPGDDASFNVPLSFPFTFFGNVFNSVNVCTNGFLSFSSTAAPFSNLPIPNAALPNDMVAVLWDDFNFAINTNDNLQHETRGTSGMDLRQIFQWTNVAQFGRTADTEFNTFQAVLFENGNIEFRYAGLGDLNFEQLTGGPGVTVGVEDSTASASSRQYGTGNDIVSSNMTIAVSPTVTPDPCEPADPCDAADFNQDGSIDPDDLGDFINCYFSMPPCDGADFNNDGSIDPDDLGDFINIYFSCA